MEFASHPKFKVWCNKVCVCLQNDVISLLFFAQDLQCLRLKSRGNNAVTHLEKPRPFVGHIDRWQWILHILARHDGAPAQASSCNETPRTSVLRMRAVSTSTTSLTAAKSPKEHKGSALRARRYLFPTHAKHCDWLLDTGTEGEAKTRRFALNQVGTYARATGVSSRDPTS